jgi:uroporphyrinogen-III synthase
MNGSLAGRRVVVTRPVGQAQELVSRLGESGAQVIELPLTQIVPIDQSPQMDAALDQIAGYEIIVVTSANGAVCLADRLEARALTLNPSTTVVAVGQATAGALIGRGIRVDRLPRRATGEAIVAELAAKDLSGVRILLPRAREGRPELPAGLRRAGATVDDIAFYETARQPVEPGAVAAIRTATDIVFTAPSGVEAFAAVGGPGVATGVRIVTIGPTTSAAARQAGLTVAAESSEQSVDGVMAALIQAAIAG